MQSIRQKTDTANLRPPYNHCGTPEYCYGREEDPRANLSEKYGGRRLAEDVGDEKYQGYDVISRPYELQVHDHPAHC